MVLPFSYLVFILAAGDRSKTCDHYYTANHHYTFYYWNSDRVESQQLACLIILGQNIVAPSHAPMDLLHTPTDDLPDGR